MTPDALIELPAVLPADVLGRRVEGVRLGGGTLREVLSPDLTHLVFLRHFG